MHHYRLALIGFGGVARALAELIRDSSPRLRDELGFDLSVVAITDLNFGSLMQSEGIDLDAVLQLPRDASFAAMPGGSAEANNERVIAETNADIVVEATFTNPTTGEPAVSHVRWALEHGRHVTTTNKGPVAIGGAELTALAERVGLRFEYEGAVMSGTPVLRLANGPLAGSRIRGVQGILNGTSNYVLGRLAAGLTLDAAVAEAQSLGYAEADPTADIGGSDVRLKVAILAQRVLGATIDAADIPTTGITGLSETDIADAERTGKTWKLIGSVARSDDGSITASVAPVALDASHPLAAISGATNAVSFDTELLGPVTISGPGAGRIETAFALLSDIVAIHTAVTR
ncbi:homoserine dehydrogenase [Leucobacter musarum]|uniref:homoserine dehydrogenase n=1 Tax=Leucobacter musarum TaxID=1930747 RepID=UPI0006A79FA6|nr:homoserine dehydrogenase [Leucobacter musarum]